jgi:excisionase family DNA binding protein
MIGKGGGPPIESAPRRAPARAPALAPEQIPPELRHLTIEQAAAILGVHPETVRAWVREGKIEAMIWGRRLHIRPAEVLRFQENCIRRVSNPVDVARAARAQRHRPGRRRQGGPLADA